MILRYLLLSFAIVLPTTVAAADRWYAVELVVYARDSGLSNEQWRADPGLPAMGSAIDLGASDGTAYSELGAGDLQLKDIAATLQRKPGYRVLMHRGWNQPGLSRSTTSAIRVAEGPSSTITLGGGDFAVGDAASTSTGQSGGQSGGQTGSQAGPAFNFSQTVTLNELQGTFKVSLARYLHLDADLLYRPSRGGERLVRMQQSRRMRSSELHYLDHPVIGVIAIITPLQRG